MTQILARSKANVLDMGQSVINGLLSLSILFELSEKDHKDQTTIKDLLFKSTELGLKLDFQVFESSKRASDEIVIRRFKYVVTMISDPISAQSIYEIAQGVAKFNLNIDIIIFKNWLVLVV